MERALRDRWVEALRSGKYEQTRGTLRRNKEQELAGMEPTPVGFCCLGVLCDVINPDGWMNLSGDTADYVYHFTREEAEAYDPDYFVDEGSDYEYDLIDYAADGMLPHILGFTIGLPLAMQETLAGYNDDGDPDEKVQIPLNFNQIADFIEATL